MSLLASLALATVLGHGQYGLRPQPAVPPLPWAAFPAAAAPEVPARAWVIYSVDSGAEIAVKDPDTQVAPASITKVMSAIIAVENVALTESVVVSPVAGGTPIGYIGQADVQTGDTWTIRDLLSVVMVGSGNRASTALAEAVAGSVTDFADLMNAKAAEFAMTNTTFHNPHGLDAVGHITTGRDLVKLGLAALEHPEILHLSRIKHVTLVGNGRITELESTNRDLGVFPGFFGIKTGDTANAGQTLLSYTETQHDRFLIVVLGSPDRREATRELTAWATTTLGPRDIFFAPAVGTDLAMAFPDWYLPRLAAAGTVPLDPGTAIADHTPLTDDLQSRFRELLPDLLGGDP